MADGDATIRLDQGGINARILAKEAKVDFRRVESASRKIQATFHSPEVKRLFVRYLNSMQLNMYLISVIGRTKLPHSLIEQVEGALKAKLENLHTEVNEALDVDWLGEVVIGANREAIFRGEDRQVFKDLMIKIGLKVPRAR